MTLPKFPARPLHYLPYHVLLNSEYHRILYCRSELIEFAVGLAFWVDKWYDWFTNEPIPNGSWITEA